MIEEFSINIEEEFPSWWNNARINIPQCSGIVSRYLMYLIINHVRRDEQ